MYKIQTRAERVLGNVLREMNAQVMDLETLARGWGVSAEWAAGRLSGKKGLTGSELRHIARVLCVPVTELSGEPEPAADVILVTPTPRIRSMVLAAAGLPDLLAGQ